MFSINQIHSERQLGELPADNPVVLFDRKCVVMTTDGKALPTVSQVFGILPPEAVMLNCGQLDGQDCWVNARSLDGAIGEGIVIMDCRTAFLQPSLDIMNAISRGRELYEWRKAHRLCGGCGQVNTFSANDLALICPVCGQRYYPQIAPAVIVAITRNNGKEILLAHNRRFSGATFSLIAGFVETGETLEQAVEREVLEETGITVKNVRYLSSQPWPFPNSLMVGFAAEYASGEAHADGMELIELNWFTRDAMPAIPAPGSIANKIITDFINLPNTTP